jgi:uncharacterized membrane protein
MVVRTLLRTVAAALLLAQVASAAPKRHASPNLPRKPPAPKPARISLPPIQLLPEEESGAPVKAQNFQALGVVALRVPDQDRNVERQANAQLRATLAAIAQLPLAEVKLPDGASPVDVARLRDYAISSDLDRVVGGEIVTHDHDRVVRLVSVPADGRAPVQVERSVRDLSQEELVAAIESAACAAAADAGNADRCVGRLVVVGRADGAQLALDGLAVGLLPLSADLTAAVGAHDVALTKDGATSALGRVYVHLDGRVTLTADETCGALAFLQPGQLAECKAPIVVVEASPLRWKGIVTTTTGVVLAASGAFFGLRANARARDLNAAYAGAGLTRDHLSTLDSLRSDAKRANVLTGLGGAIAAAGGLVYAFDF